MERFEIYRNRTILVTGHTGFKGSWLAGWLHSIGARVVGYSLPPPTQPAHWPLLKLPIESIDGDIRDVVKLESTFGKYRPDLIVHMAAQPLVRRSYRETFETYSSNVIGTLNVCEAARHAGGVKGIVVVTSDKVYANRERETGYTETDRLGGHDPYSASKACCELLVDSYRNSFFPSTTFGKNHHTLLATVRAGNVIGGGDWAEDRLIPDAVRAVTNGTPLVIRSPKSIRPWQHVLDPLAGYLLVGRQLLEKNPAAATPWNFGPDDEGNVTVETVIERVRSAWPKLDVRIESNPNAPHETGVLKLDSSKAKRELGWRPVWNWQTAVDRTVTWYRDHLVSGRVQTQSDLQEFIHALT